MIRITCYRSTSNSTYRHPPKGHTHEPLRAPGNTSRIRLSGRHCLRCAGFATECVADATNTSIRERRCEGVEINRRTQLAVTASSSRTPANHTGVRWRDEENRGAGWIVESPCLGNRQVLLASCECTWNDAYRRQYRGQNYT